LPPIAVPSGPDALTPEWLTDALRAGGVITRARVTEARIEPADEGRAFAGAPVRAWLTYDRDDEGAPPSLVTKFAAAEPRMRGALSGLRWYESEIRFYEELATDSEIRTPRRYFSAMDIDQLDYVLLIEDVVWGDVGDQIAGGSLAQATVVVEHVARLQQQWWEHPRLDGLDWLASGAARRVEGAGGWQSFYRRGWDILGELMPGLTGGEVRSVAERLGGVYAGILRASAESPRTLIHGDCRLDNIFFSRDSLSGQPAEPPTFIDWQLLSCGRGVYDIAYFLGTNFSPELRRTHELDLLRRYHAIISQPAGDAPDATPQRAGGEYDFEICLRDYRLAMMLVFGFWVQTAGAATFPAAAHPLRDAALERVSAALLDLDAGELLEELGA